MKIACVLDSGFEDSEFRVPHDGFRDAGHQVTVIGLEKHRKLTGKSGKESATTVVSFDDVTAADFDALFIPGGYSPDHLRADRRAVRFVAEFGTTHKPIFAVCHGPQLLSAADAINGRRLTAWSTIQDDLRRMGEDVVDEEVVVSGNLVTSRKPDDLEAFTRQSLLLLRGVPASTR